MPPRILPFIAPIRISHPPAAASEVAYITANVSLFTVSRYRERPFAGRMGARILIRPEPGFYVMRLRSGAPLVPAIIYQICPMVIPEPTTVTGPHPDEWCRPLDRSPRFAARVDGKRVDVERVWTARSLRQVSRDEFDFRAGPLRRWARSNPTAPEAQPHRPVDLTALPPLF